jgi:membrane-bound lytic murein transglycosylase D
MSVGLNPAFEPQQALPSGARIELPARLVPTYEKYCAGGKWVELAAEWHSSAAPVAPPTARTAKASRSVAARSYVVRKGETLGAIGRKTGCGVGELAGANHLKAPAYAVHPGQTLQVPSTCRK